ncbi:hypothetical protein [Pseudactinotalea suaedae]|uniref:hypothetical protein n=1 Tax=Pseudactinotalea suaedae TaxID=1524924 RepID=UPI0012E22CF2|nr:hypothetical protein [Pseudactinotalea suaedae]
MTQPPDPSEPTTASEPEAASGPWGHYGRSPDPTGAYPGPDQGSYTPLPRIDEGDYRPPGPGYSGGDLGPEAAQATDSLRRAWRIFAAHPWPFVLSQLIWGAIMAAPVLVLLLAFGAMSLGGRDPGAGLSALFGVGGLVVVLVVVLLAVIQQGAFATATLKAVDGVRVGLGDFFRPRHLLQLVLLALILGLAAALLAVTGIGPVVVMFFGIWAVLLVVDRGLPAIEALRSSVTASLRNPGQTIVLVLAAYLMNAVGVLLCGLGTLVSTPVGVLAFADHYRRSASFARR